VIDLIDDHMKDFDAIDHLEGKSGAVRDDDGLVVLAGQSRR
jgi:hypothetical protein